MVSTIEEMKKITNTVQPSLGTLWGLLPGLPEYTKIFADLSFIVSPEEPGIQKVGLPYTWVSHPENTVFSIRLGLEKWTDAVQIHVEGSIV